MSWTDAARERLRAVFRRRTAERELDDEIRFHLEMEVEKLVRAGVPPAEARHRAARAFGGVARTKEAVRDERGVAWLEDVVRDVRHALRRLRHRPGFALVVVVTLALGIGGTTTVFGVVRGVLLKPLPYDQADELVALWHTVPSKGTDRFHQSLATYLTYREENRVFENVGIWFRRAMTVTGLDEPEEVDAAIVTEGVFPILAVQPALGRGFVPQDLVPGTSFRVILSHGYWERRFGSDRAAVGRTVHVDGVPAEIIGVMPATFRFIHFDPALYVPFIFRRSSVAMGGGFGFQGVARLSPGRSLDDANRDVARMLPLTVEKFPGRRFARATIEEWGMGPNVISLKRDVVGDVGRLLWVLLGTVGVVLLIACANVANLFLVQAEGRRREVSVRVALGAARGRIARQLLAESAVLGLIGGAVGLALARAGVGLVVRLAPDTLPRAHEIGVDGMVLLFTVAVSLAAGLAFGLIPVLRYGRSNLAGSLREGGRGGGEGRRPRRVRTVLAVSQIALALVLLIGSGLMIRSVVALRRVAPGFERPDQVLTLRVTATRSDAPTPDDVARQHERILDRLAAIPGVRSVGAVSAVTLDGRSPDYATFVEGVPTAEDQFPPSRRYKWILGGYFETMGNRVLAGRGLTRDDVQRREPVVVVTANFAREFWGDPSRALGKRIRNNPSDPWRTIVGVVGDVHDDGLDRPAPAVVYWPLVVETFDGSDVFVRRTMAFALRTEGRDPRSLLPDVREAVRAVNPDAPLADVRTLDDLLAGSMARTSFTLAMLAIAAVVALLLGTVGIYGVISYTVARRTREIGVRVALGATRLTVSRDVMRGGALVAAAGVGAGLATAAGLTRLMAALLFGVRAFDPPTYAAAAIAVIAVSLAASYFPARRATRIDPVEAIREE